MYTAALDSSTALAALEYAARGWRVFPCNSLTPAGCSCGKPDCGKTSGKHPRTVNGVKDATTDPATIRAWWGRWPDANIGIATGAASGFFAVDCDGAEGIEQFEHVAGGQARPDAPEVRTGSGGRHLYFAAAGIGNRQRVRGCSIDIRGDGGYVMAPPSNHMSGNRYEWLTPPNGTIPPAPDWLLEWLTDPPAPPPPPRPSTSTGDFGPALIDRARKYVVKLPPSISGSGGHNAAMAVARVLRWGFALDEATAYDIFVQDFNPRCVPPWSEKEIRHKLDDGAKPNSTHAYGWLRDATRNGGAGHVGGKQSASTAIVKAQRAAIAVVASSDVVPEEEETFPDEPNPLDPGPFPVDLITPPGLVGAIVEHNLATAMYPQPVLALAGALTLMATITGRRIADARNTRTNLYAVGIAPTSAGKDHARKLNKAILMAGGAENMIGPERIGSHAGIINAVAESPSLLFMIDEISHLLATMKNSGRSPWLYNISAVLLQLYGSSDGLWIADALADTSRVKRINQPHAVVYGSSTPEKFWANLSTDNVTEGLLGRCLIFEAAYVPFTELLIAV